MVAKKRNTLRNKAEARLGGRAKVEAEAEILEELPEDPKAYLHQYKETKKDKQQSRQSDFLSKIQNKNNRFDPLYDGVSKSSVRRRKRKMRDTLKPKMEDLLISLEQETDLQEFTKDIEDQDINSIIADDEPIMRTSVTKIVKKIEAGSVTIRKNEPNIRNKKGAKMLAMKERERFNEVLSNQVFQQNSFSALRDIIKMQKR